MFGAAVWELPVITKGLSVVIKTEHAQIITRKPFEPRRPVLMKTNLHGIQTYRSEFSRICKPAVLLCYLGSIRVKSPVKNAPAKNKCIHWDRMMDQSLDTGKVEVHRTGCRSIKMMTEGSSVFFCFFFNHENSVPLLSNIDTVCWVKWTVLLWLIWRKGFLLNIIYCFFFYCSGVFNANQYYGTPLHWVQGSETIMKNLREWMLWAFTPRKSNRCEIWLSSPKLWHLFYKAWDMKTTTGTQQYCAACCWLRRSVLAWSRKSPGQLISRYSVPTPPVCVHHSLCRNTSCCHTLPFDS